MKKQQKPTPEKPESTFLVDTPFIMVVWKDEDKIAWATDIHEEHIPDWADDDIPCGYFDKSGACGSLAKAQDAALRSARASFKKYKRILNKTAAKLTKQIAKDLAKLEVKP